MQDHVDEGSHCDHYRRNAVDDLERRPLRSVGVLLQTNSQRRHQVESGNDISVRIDLKILLCALESVIEVAGLIFLSQGE